MKKIVFFILFLFILSMSAFGANNKHQVINKNDTHLETKSVRVYGDDYSAEISIIVWIDNESSVLEPHIRIKLISSKKNEEYCDKVKITLGDPIYVGKSGCDPTAYEFVGSYRRWFTDTYRCACEAIYDIDMNVLFDSDKIRVSTVNSHIDINIKSARKELKKLYDKTCLIADETFNQKTNPTYNF